MTKAQEKKVDLLRELAEDHAAVSALDIIKFEVEEISKETTSVAIWFGRMSFARDTAHLFIKTRGRIEYPYHPDGTLFTTIYRNFNGKTLTDVIREQRKGSPLAK